VRAGAPVFTAQEGGEPVGQVSSGGFGPSVDGPVAMGIVSEEWSREGTPLFAEVRGKRLPIGVTSLPFVKQTYKR
jgi:aminomethyltransferase